MIRDDQRASPEPNFRKLTILSAAVAFGLTAAAVAAVSATGMRVEWTELTGLAVKLTVVLMLWAWFRMRASRRGNTSVVADTFLVTALLSMVSLFGSLLQYPIVALGLPLADGWLASVDALLHVDLPGLSRWTARHSDIAAALTSAYFSLLTQLFVAPLILGLWYRDRAALWEYAWHFQFCIVVALGGLLLFPAESPWNHYPLDSLFDHARFNTQFAALHSGTMSVVHPNELEGLITFPSFHTAGGLLTTWSFRRYPVSAMVFASINVMLIAATVLSGTHYSMDLIGAGLVFGISVRLWRQFAQTASLASVESTVVSIAPIESIARA